MGRLKKTTTDGIAAMSIRLPVAIRDEIAKQASFNRRSLNQEILWLLEKALRMSDPAPATKDSQQSG